MDIMKKDRTDNAIEQGDKNETICIMRLAQMPRKRLLAKKSSKKASWFTAYGLIIPLLV